MRTIIISALLLATCCSIEQTLADKDEETCLGEIETKVSPLLENVPEEITNLVSGIRGLNPSLNDLSLTKLFDDRRAEVNGLEEKGVVSTKDSDEVARICSDFIKQSMDSMSIDGCSEVFAIESTIGGFTTISNYQAPIDEDNHSKIDQVIGLTRACLRL